MLEEELTKEIIRVFYKVYNCLGYGFIESVYHNAVILELVKSRLKVESEKSIAVYYEGQIVGNFSADLVVESKVIIELKARERLVEAHEAQLLNYLRSTKIEIGLLLNFGKSPEFKRKYFSNEHKAKRIDGHHENVLDGIFIKDPFESA
jgi:GxxExxY protein